MFWFFRHFVFAEGDHEHDWILDDSARNTYYYVEAVKWKFKALILSLRLYYAMYIQQLSNSQFRFIPSAYQSDPNLSGKGQQEKDWLILSTDKNHKRSSIWRFDVIWTERFEEERTKWLYYWILQCHIICNAIKSQLDGGNIREFNTMPKVISRWVNALWSYQSLRCKSFPWEYLSII